jgi:hypothetical protein
LKFRFKATGGSSSQQDWSFSGGMQSAGSLFNNISIQAGGAVLESMQNYHVWHNNVVEWMHDGTAMQRIESMCSGARIPENDYPSGGAVQMRVVGTPTASTTLSAAQYINQSRAPIVPGMILIGAGELGARTVLTVAADGALSFSGSNVTWTNDQQFILVLPALYSAQQVNGYQTDAMLTDSAVSNFEWSQAVGQANSLFQFNGSASGSQKIDMVFTIPLFCGFFNPKESQLIPLEFTHVVGKSVSSQSIIKIFVRYNFDFATT